MSRYLTFAVKGLMLATVLPGSFAGIVHAGNLDHLQNLPAGAGLASDKTIDVAHVGYTYSLKVKWNGSDLWDWRLQLPKGYIYCDHWRSIIVNRGATRHYARPYDNFSLKVLINVAGSHNPFDRRGAHLKQRVVLKGITMGASRTDRKKHGCKPLPF